MRNLALIDRPKTIGGLEYFDLMLALVPAVLITAVLYIMNFLLAAFFPFLVMLGGFYIREKKRDKNYGYFQRRLGKLLYRRERKFYAR